MFSLRRILPALIGLVLTPAAAIVAQDTTSPASATPQANQNQVRPDGVRRREMRLRRGVGRRTMRDGLRQLNLSDEQKQQRREILQRHLSALKTQREQLFELRTRKMEGSLTDADRARARSIRQNLRATMLGVRGELRNTLNADQRAQLESFRQQRKQQREEFMNRRQEFRRMRPPE
jgi:hypothetical protein